MEHPESFVLEILNTRNGTWQGTVTWVRKQKTQTFRSALEMIQLLDSAVQPEADFGAKIPERQTDGR